MTGHGRQAAQRPPEMAFRPLARSDFVRLEGWLRQAHVVEWWGTPLDQDLIERKYGPRVDDVEPVLVFIIELAGRPVGWIQTFLLTDQPQDAEAVGILDAAGMDVAIGELSVVGRGLGRHIISAFVRRVVFPAFPNVTCCVACPALRNRRAQRAFAAAGFRPVKTVRSAHGDLEVVMVGSRADLGE